MVDIPAEVTPGSAFEHAAGHASTKDLAIAVNEATKSQHGHAGVAWLRWCIAQSPEVLRRQVAEGVARLSAKWAPPNASGQVHRVARRFALVAVAGELATEAGITGWQRTEAVRGVKLCFDAWLAARPGGAGIAEEASMIEQVRRWILMNDARFTRWARVLDERAPDKMMRAGFRARVENGKIVETLQAGELAAESDFDATGVGLEYFIFVDVFKKEVCEGYEPAAVLRLLRSRGFLEVQEEGKFYVRRRAPGFGGRQVPFIHVKSEVFTTAD